MRSALAFPPARRLEGALRVPASKSATNRALVLAALSANDVTLVDPLDSDDTRALRRCLAQMGGRIEEVPEGLRVGGPLGRPPSDATVNLDARDSGTAARFLTAIASATPGAFRVTGSPRLRERPFGELVTALRALGADLEEEGRPGCLPLLLRGRVRSSGSVSVDAARSSQFLSAVMLLGAAGESLEVAAAGAIVSRPYADLTLASLRAFGHTVEGDGPWRIRRGSATPSRHEIPGDFSSAVPLLAALGVCGGEIRLHGVALPSSEADARAVPVLREMGLDVEAAAGGAGIIARSRRGGLRPVAARASDFPDSVPALAALAAFAPGESRFDGIGHLRWKESDRLAALADLLRRAGAEAIATEESLLVRGTPAAGDLARLSTFGDHRIAMAAAILSVGRGRLLIDDPDCVAKSYPRFFADLDSLCVR
ncbi:MAG: 3-phosphoshikimate 1-carboxyvinyltransferase [Acidobacteriota bacterium]|nr:3-phosphoshikimate 1-carboxyvinyltransferase [Acidobacteriota bacterium]